MDQDQDWLIRLCPSFSSALSLLQPSKCFILKQGCIFFLNPFCPFGRFGIGRFTTEEEVDYTAEKCIFHVSRLREMRSVQSHFESCPNRMAHFIYFCLCPSVLCGRWFRKASISRASSGRSTRLPFDQSKGLWIQQIDQLLSFLSTNTHKLPVWLEVFVFVEAPRWKKSTCIHAVATLNMLVHTPNFTLISYLYVLSSNFM